MAESSAHTLLDRQRLARLTMSAPEIRGPVDHAREETRALSELKSYSDISLMRSQVSSRVTSTPSIRAGGGVRIMRPSSKRTLRTCGAVKRTGSQLASTTVVSVRPSKRVVAAIRGVLPRRAFRQGRPPVDQHGHHAAVGGERDQAHAARSVGHADLPALGIDGARRCQPPDADDARVLRCHGDLPRCQLKASRRDRRCERDSMAAGISASRATTPTTMKVSEKAIICAWACSMPPRYS